MEIKETLLSTNTHRELSSIRNGYIPRNGQLTKDKS